MQVVGSDVGFDQLHDVGAHPILFIPAMAPVRLACLIPATLVFLACAAIGPVGVELGDVEAGGGSGDDASLHAARGGELFQYLELYALSDGAWTRPVDGSGSLAGQAVRLLCLSRAQSTPRPKAAREA